MIGRNVRLVFLAIAVLLLFAVNPAAAFYGEVDWVKINPNLKGAASINSIDGCVECHADYIKLFNKSKHAKSIKYKSGDIGIQNTCEACHGPLSKHLEEPDLGKKLDSVISFKTITPKQKSAICLQCHESESRMHWRGSAHEMMGGSCDKCHYVMTKKSRKAMLISEDPKNSCFQCHKQQRSLMERTSHHPLREGKLSCTSCHNPHGGIGPKLLNTASVNETCYQCHQEKRGPYIWEHPPVRENCSGCHEPHGSNLDSLLKIKMPYLCENCHSNTQHPSNIYDNRALGTRSGSLSRVIGKSCLNCHGMVHGSNHPSGARLTR